MDGAYDGEPTYDLLIQRTLGLPLPDLVALGEAAISRYKRIIGLIFLYCWRLLAAIEGYLALRNCSNSANGPAAASGNTIDALC